MILFKIIYNVKIFFMDKNILITINIKAFLIYFLIHEISFIIIYFLGFNSLQLFFSVYKV